MKDNIIYRENRASTGIFVLLLGVTLAMIAVLVFQLIYGPLGSNPAPDGILALFAVFFFLLSINFRHIKITLTDEHIKVCYGLFCKTLNWQEVVGCELDEKNYFYGWGIRFGRYKKQWVWIYNAMGGPRLAFLTDKKKPKGLILSTKNPQEMMRIAKKKIGNQ